MTEQHRITPPPELVQQWASAQNYTIAPAWILNEIAQKAAQWGSDQELEACCEWLFTEDYDVAPVRLRAARRPKSPSLKQQALEGLKRFESMGEFFNDETKDLDTIRRALEQLDD